MPFQNQISITGKTGVGTTSLYNALMVKLARDPYRWFSAGLLFRQRGEQLGMSVDEFAKYCKEHPEDEHDQWVDVTIQDNARADWMICDGRIPHFLMPHAFKVLVTCGLGTRAYRRHRDQPDPREKTLRQVLSEISERDLNDEDRNRLRHPGCIWQPKQFDLALSTDDSYESASPPDVLADRVIEEHKLWVARQKQSPVQV